MKKLIVFILVAVLTTPAFAQYDSNRKRSRYNHNDTERYYGLRLGLNVASISCETATMDMDSQAGVAFGAVYGFQLANAAPIWMETGLFYSAKGGKTDTNGYKVTCNLNYLQLPVVVKYSLELIDDLFLQPYVGGYLAMGIGGKTKDYSTKDSYSSYNNFHHFDGGLRFGCGLEYSMVYAEAGFDLGLANINKNDFDTAHTRNFYVNIGVNF